MWEKNSRTGEESLLRCDGVNAISFGVGGSFSTEEVEIILSQRKP
jgi:hypothetical protein